MAKSLVTDSPDSVALEKLIDSYSLRAVLDHIGDICRIKGTHIEDNWQDGPLARRWYAAAGVAEKAAVNPKVKKVSA
jgi:hypothetical protein